jgi:hypothetical protein
MKQNRETFSRSANKQTRKERPMRTEWTDTFNRNTMLQVALQEFQQRYNSAVAIFEKQSVEMPKMLAVLDALAADLDGLGDDPTRDCRSRLDPDWEPNPGIRVTLCSPGALQCPIVWVARALLPEVRKRVGPLHVIGKHVTDSRNRRLSVNLKCDKYPDLVFTYSRPFPSENGRCRVVKVDTSYYTLACDR